MADPLRADDLGLCVAVVNLCGAAGFMQPAIVEESTGEDVDHGNGEFASGMQRALSSVLFFRKLWSMSSRNSLNSPSANAFKFLAHLSERVNLLPTSPTSHLM